MKHLILAALLASSVAFAQPVTVACTATGYCGTAQSSATNYGTGNENYWVGLPFTVNSNYSVTNAQVYFGSGTGPVTVTIVTDSNASGTTLGGGSVISGCTSTISTITNSATNTFTFSGCSVSTSTARLWLMLNTSDGSVEYLGPATGTDNWYIAATYTGSPTTISGTLSDNASVLSMGITLAAGSTPPLMPPMILKLLSPREIFAALRLPSGAAPSGAR
jgi:hypothetical protein